MKNWIAFGLIFSWLCPGISGYGQFYEKTEEVPVEIYQNYELYHDLNNRFYEQSQSFEYFKSDPVQPIPNEILYDDDIQDPPIDDDPPVPIGDFWVICIFISGIALGVFYQLKKQNKLSETK